MAKKVKLIGKEDWSEALHVALRKGCDSSPSSAAWNCIYLLKDGLWGEYVDFVYESMKTFDTTKLPTLPEMLKRASLKWKPYGKGHAAVTLYCIFELFEDEDWEGYSSFLVRA